MRTRILLATAALNICWIVPGHAQEVNLPSERVDLRHLSIATVGN